MTNYSIPKGKSICDCDASLIDAFRRDFTNPNVTVKEMEDKYNRPSGTLYRYAVDLKLKRPSRIKESPEKQDLLTMLLNRVATLPRIDFPYHVPTVIGRPASMVLELSDLHFGRKTDSFDANVAINRLARLRDEIIEYALDMSRRYDVATLDIFALGDLVVGEAIGQKVNLEEVEQFIYDQIFTIAVPSLTEFILTMLNTFEFINFHGVRGNHGDVGKYASKSANWDTFIYQILAQRLAEQPRVKFNVATRTWYNYADVQDTKWLLVHGDQFPVSGGAPQKGVTDKVSRWRGSLPKSFSHVAFGHYHSTMQFVANDIPCYGNGTLLTDDDWVRENLALKGSCSQTALIVTGDKVIDEHEVYLGGD